MALEVTRAVSFALEDDRWRNKLGVLLLLSFVPGLNLIVWMGYSISIAHNIIRGASRPLPEWSDWSDILIRGLMACSASLIYFSPVLLALVLGAVLNTLTKTSGSVLLCVGPFILLGSAAAFLLITVSHVRYARSDQYGDYYAPFKRLQEFRWNLREYMAGSLVQFGLLVTVLLAVPLLSITLIGPFAIIMIAFLAHGYLIGQLARKARRRQ